MGHGAFTFQMKLIFLTGIVPTCGECDPGRRRSGFDGFDSQCPAWTRRTGKSLHPVLPKARMRRAGGR